MMFFVFQGISVAGADIASAAYVKNITNALDQRVSNAQQTADNAVAAVERNWGKIPMESDGVEVSVARIWIE